MKIAVTTGVVEVTRRALRRRVALFVAQGAGRDFGLRFASRAAFFKYCKASITRALLPLWQGTREALKRSVAEWLRPLRRDARKLWALLRLAARPALLAALMLAAGGAAPQVPCVGPGRVPLLEFVEQTGAGNPFVGLPFGAREFGDIDGDGDADMFLNGDFYRNVGAPGAPQFELAAEEENPLKGYLPNLADIDADGDLDAFVCATKIHFFENTGTPQAPSMMQREGAQNPLSVLDAYVDEDDLSPSFSTMGFVDLDSDGDLDAFAQEDGTFWRRLNLYCENVGTASAPVFEVRDENPLRDLYNPRFLDIDSDGDLDAVTFSLYSWTSYGKTSFGSQSWVSCRFNVGTPQAPELDGPEWETASLAPSITTNFIDYNWSTVYDVDSDGDTDLCFVDKYYTPEAGCETIHEPPEFFCGDITLLVNAQGSTPALYRYQFYELMAPVRYELDKVEFDLFSVSCGYLGDWAATLRASWLDDWRAVGQDCDITVHIVDKMAPIVFITGDPAVTIPFGQDYVEPGAVAWDNCDTPPVQMGGDAVDSNTPGLYVITYDAVDDAGNHAARVTRRVTVSDGGDIEGASSEGETPWVDFLAYELLSNFGGLDADHDAKLSWEEIRQVYSGNMEDWQYFGWNTNGDIGLSLPELHNTESISWPSYGNITSDTNGDFKISFGELMRLIQLYNAGGYTCAEMPGASEDGFLPRPPVPSDPLCVKHTLDREDVFNYVISLSELLRGIQFYALGGYRLCDISDDGYCGP